MTADPPPDDVATSALGDCWRIDLVHRSLAVRLQPDGQVRCKWFAESRQQPEIRLSRHPSLAEAAQALWPEALTWLGEDCQRVYHSLDLAARHFRHGGAGFRPRTAVARQQVTTQAQAATRVALGYADVLCWCEDQGVTIDRTGLPDFLYSAWDDRCADRTQHIGLDSAIAQRALRLSTQILTE
jgi:hypothetical protein